jgi:hypothetical protein
LPETRLERSRFESGGRLRVRYSENHGQRRRPESTFAFFC